MSLYGSVAELVSRYICEISPPQVRGTLASVPQLIITIGICVGYFVCYGSVDISTSLSWRLPFALQALIAFCFTLSTLLLLPHSPRWLTLKGRKEEAAALWDKLGVSSEEREQDEVVRVESKVITSEVGIAELAVDSNPGLKVKARRLIRVFRKDVRKRTALGVFLMGMQQLSGIDGVLYVSIPQTVYYKSNANTKVRAVIVPTSRPQFFQFFIPGLWYLGHSHLPSHNSRFPIR
jgi:hypothetical protein